MRYPYDHGGSLWDRLSPLMRWALIVVATLYFGAGLVLPIVAVLSR